MQESAPLNIVILHCRLVGQCFVPVIQPHTSDIYGQSLSCNEQVLQWDTEHACQTQNTNCEISFSIFSSILKARWHINTHYY